jgi:hypothetical protein
MKQVLFDQGRLWIAWHTLIIDLREVNETLRKTPLLWEIGAALVLFVIPILLLVVHYLVLTIIPVQLTVSGLNLNFSQPTISGMFFSSYIHDVWLPEHLVNNYLAYVINMYGVFLFYFVATRS